MKVYSSHHTRKVRFVRFIARRKPCTFLLFIQNVIMILLAGSFALSKIIYDSTIKSMMVMQKESQIYDIYAGTITLPNCHYDDFKNYTELCEKHCGESANIVLIRNSLLQNEGKSENCLPVIETKKCHERFAQCETQRTRKCPGVNGVPLPKNIMITPQSIVKVPIVDVSLLQNETVSALEMFVQCPRCMIHSHSYRRTDEICYRRLETVREGWPENYRFCDDEIMRKAAFCATLDN
ncbi:unnamed protein product [Thelazia callipaeda]|uniref:FZ domain-containing protein n=1 Tax=Thelazia callipaeda TaxID=103827 RepID=A0A0N5D494_THECL|nr:unnamed protein product [Thelazia callipaeda]